MIRVAVVGALGRMGREVVCAVMRDPELELACVVDTAATRLAGGAVHPDCDMRVLGDVSEVAGDFVDVMVDFTVADAAVRTVRWALEKGVHVVLGTTGIPVSEIEALGREAESGEANLFVAPNFAIGAAVMMRISAVAAGVFDQCEIIELHHRGKADAPSGTALATARLVDDAMKASAVPLSAPNEIEGTRGGSLGGVNIHSVRLDGFVAHQQVVFGAPGQVLTIRHDATDRSCFMPGVLLAVKRVPEMRGMTVGLERLLWT